MILVAGLGNPGREYEGTRHNMGYMAVDALADDLSLSFDKKDFKGIYCRYRNPELDDDVILLKPETFMNLSGESVQACASFFKIPLDKIVVVYDDMAINPGHIRLRKDGSSGGHKGMGDIINKMGTANIKRIRIGIGEPAFNPVDFVLGKPKGDELALCEQGIDLAKKAIKDYLLRGFDHAMNAYNR